MNPATEALPPALAVTREIGRLLDPIFISDLHLTHERPRTLARFLRFMGSLSTRYRSRCATGH